MPIDSSAVLSGTGAAFLKKAENGDWEGTPPLGSEILIALPGVNQESQSGAVSQAACSLRYAVKIHPLHRKTPF